MKHFCIVQIILLLSALCSGAQAFYEREPWPLPRTVKNSQAIVIASLTHYAPVGGQTNGTEAAPAEQTWTFDANRKDPVGLYSFSVIMPLQGQLEEKLQLSLPQYYRSGKLGIKEGQHVLLFLHSNVPADWTPVDPLVPFIKLADDKLEDKDNKAGKPLLSTVVSLVLDSLRDPALRRQNIRRLRDVVDPQIVEKLPAYLDDPDILVRDNVLYSLAINQQVSVIPRIAKLNAQLMLSDSNAESIVALQKFKTPEAVPYLNPLLFESDQYIRVNTAYALQSLATSNSIPYLMLALRDPETQNVVGYTAYRTLHRLIPELGHPKDWTLFKIQREAERRRLYLWWQDELMGKHLHLLQVGEQTPKPENDVSALFVGKLNPLLFEPFPAIRQKALTALVKRADRSSIPYLILALTDPDTIISYGAYITLHRLIPTLGIAADHGSFEANREATNRPIYHWWEDELTGNHVGLKKAVHVPIPKNG